MKRRPRRRYHAMRRVPQAYPGLYLRLKVAPILPALAATVAVGALAEISVLPDNLRGRARSLSDAMGTAISEKSQRIFFDAPGLDTLLIRSLSHVARRTATVGRAWARLVVAVGADKDGRMARMRPLIPKRGYDALMTGMLTVGTAVGALRGGAVHVALLRDSAADPPFQPPLPDHPEAQIRRVDAPETLSDMCADIDELYWSRTLGPAVKITRVGEGEARRWLMSLVGTESMTFRSTHNPADIEANIRLMLGLEASMSVGVVRALHAAMERDGVPAEDRARQPVFICGHSQGGIVAAALASVPPHEAEVNIVGILSTGGPNRRIRVRPNVVTVAITHDQDVVPSMDGSPDRAPDRRVAVGRSLVRPRNRPLYYAHSSSTYTETVRLLERKVRVTPWGRLASSMAALQDFLPTPGEATRVMHYEIWQDLLTPTADNTWNTVAALEHRGSYEPTTYPIDYVATVPRLPRVARSRSPRPGTSPGAFLRALLAYRKDRS
ncbi:lysophospholipase [Schaalia meyeri]|uniref:lysophospholipase n=1 Tax=Schaalia meyeri TaxID=52773 RepID=UPI0020444181|nr:lysophospholipase [Schaalia meyeri]MCM3898964.1 lysophospholipase [Schaalia meyeri]